MKLDRNIFLTIPNKMRRIVFQPLDIQDCFFHEASCDLKLLIGAITMKDQEVVITPGAPSQPNAMSKEMADSSFLVVVVLMIIVTDGGGCLDDSDRWWWLW